MVEGTVAMMTVRDVVGYPWGLLHGTEARIETSCHLTHMIWEYSSSYTSRNWLKSPPWFRISILIDEAARIYQMLADRNPDLFGAIFDWSENTRLKHLSSLENSIR